MRFLMLVCIERDPVENPDEPTLGIETWVDTMDGNGKRVLGERIAPDADARAVRVRDGEVVVTDGPYVETKEIVAGFDVLECADLDDAIAVAAAHPMATRGVLELRPFWTD